MAMQMQRAFNARMMSKMVRYSISDGTYDDNNVWVEGRKKKNNIFGVIQAGNKFSQFEEGIARHIEEGGERSTDYWSLYVLERYALNMSDKILFHGNYYNVLQQSDEREFGFRSYLTEKSERWSPT